jgi:hypothetical protein
LSRSLSARAPSRALARRPCAHTRVRRRRAEPLGLSRTRPAPHTHTHAHAPRGLASGRPRPELAVGLSSLTFRERACAHSKCTSPVPVTPAAPPSLFPQA